jgi:acetyl-CoA acyltransferase
MTQLARQFGERPEVRYGLTAMCVGMGMGGAVIWENPHWSEREGSQRERGATTAVQPEGRGPDSWEERAQHGGGR